MVNSINPTYRPIQPKSTIKRQEAASAVETHTDERRAMAKTKPSVERRKRSDRRNKYKKVNNGSYDMRSSQGRRREDRGAMPSIEIDV